MGHVGRLRVLGLVLVLSAGVMEAGTGAARADATTFEYRGVVEVSYGKPWSHATRIAMFEWMSRQGLNVYVHAPKDDPWQRANWRRPYPDETRARLLAEQDAAESQGVHWVPNISPALPTLPGPAAPGTVPSAPICFSCPADLEMLVAKYEPFVANGASVLELSFDDVFMLSPWPADLLAYGTGPAASGRMHRDLANAFAARIAAIAPGEAPRVIVVLAEYSGTRDSPYLRAVRSEGGLDPGIEVGWTGSDVVAAQITATEAAAYAGLVGRDRIVLGDNYPTNDFTGPAFRAPPTRLYLGPYVGRDAKLTDTTLGVVLNPMGDALASRVALATFAAWAADPPAYDPEAAWRSALDDTAGPGPAERDALAALAENSRSSILDSAESAVFEAEVAALRAGLESGFWHEPAAALRAELQREKGAPTTLHTAAPELAADLEPWLDRLGRNAAVAEGCVDLLVSGHPTLDVSAVPREDTIELVGRVRAPDPAVIVRKFAGMLSRWSGSWSWQVTHGDRFTPVIGGVMAGRNRIDAFVASSASLTARRLPEALLGRDVTLRVDNRPVRVARDGSFAVEVPPGTSVVRVEAVAGDAHTVVDLEI